MSFLEHTIPFLRLPLIVNDAVATGLTFKVLSHWTFFWHSDAVAPQSLVIVLLISLVLTVLLAILHLISRRKSYDHSRRRRLEKVILYGIAPASDLALAATFVVLHVINVVMADKNDHPTIMMMYCAFGALVASVLHFVLGMAAAHVCIVKCIKHHHTCPRCDRSVGGSPIYVSIRATKDEECPDYHVAMSGNESESDADEGDRLITPDSEE